MACAPCAAVVDHALVASEHEPIARRTARVWRCRRCQARQVRFVDDLPEGSAAEDAAA